MTRHAATKAISEGTYSERMTSVRREMDDVAVSAVISSDPDDLRYLTGVHVAQGLLMLHGSGGYLLTDARHQHRLVEFCERGAWECNVVQPGVGAAARDWVAALPPSLGRIAVDPAQIPTPLWQALNDAHPNQVVSVPGIISRTRAKKSAEEIAIIEHAVGIAGSAYLTALSEVRPDMTEWQFAARLEHAARELGADAMAFPTMVGFGSRSAEPGAFASNASLQGEGWLMVDWGVDVDGYVCDLARTVFLGSCSREQQRDYALVRAALEAGIGSIRPGVTGSEVYEKILSVLAEAGEDERFGHLAGHSVGIGPHEPPYIHSRSSWPFEEGYALSVEVGLYRFGDGGIRLEHQLVVTDCGCRVLSEMPGLDLVMVVDGKS